MGAVLWTITWRLAVCAVVSGMAWRLGGPVPAVISLPLIGILLAAPLIELASQLRHGVRAAALHEVEGRHYAYRGQTIRVQEDERHHRWLHAGDLRTVLGEGAARALRARIPAEAWRAFGRPGQPHIQAEALLAHLEKAREPATGKFHHWLERDVAFPARQRRRQAGIRDEHADAEPGRPDA